MKNILIRNWEKYEKYSYTVGNWKKYKNTLIRNWEKYEKYSYKKLRKIFL